MTTLGTKLRRLRDNKKMSQTEIADLLGISQSAYNKWEADQAKPNIDNLRKIADFHNTDIYDLIEGKSVVQTNSDQAVGYVEGDLTINNTLPEKITDNILKNQEQITKLIEVQNKLIESLLKK